MVDMLGLIITSGKVFAAVAAIATGVTVLARFLWSIHKFTIRIEQSHAALQKVIGNNGGKTLFARLDEVEAAVKSNDEITVGLVKAVEEIRKAIAAQDLASARELRKRSEGTR